MGMCWLLREFIDGKCFAVERTAYRTGSLVIHGHPFKLLNADTLMELESSHVVRSQDFSPGNHFHAVLRLAEHAAASLSEGVLVDDDFAEVPDNIIRTFACGDAAQDCSLDSIRQFTVDITSQRQVVLRHEIEGVGIDDSEYLGGQLVDAIRLEVGIEWQ